VQEERLDRYTVSIPLLFSRTLRALENIAKLFKSHYKCLKAVIILNKEKTLRFFTSTFLRIVQEERLEAYSFSTPLPFFRTEGSQKYGKAFQVSREAASSSFFLAHQSKIQRN
jgi:hypothetical protein